MDFNKLLYIGVYDHIEITEYFKCNEYIFVDLQPLVSWDIFDKSSKTIEFYRDDFVPFILNKFESKGYLLQNIINLNNITQELGKYTEPNLMIFENKKMNQIIKYYISTNIRYDLENITSLQKDITESDALYVAGHHPHKIILDYFKNKKAFISDSGTLYYIDDDNNNNDDSQQTIIDIFGYNISYTEKYFNSFYNITREDKYPYKFNSFNEFIKYNNFAQKMEKKSYIKAIKSF